MKHVRRLVAPVLILLVSSTALGDIRIQLIKGKRTVKDKVSFTVEVTHEKDENPRYAKMPEFIQIDVTFASPASGAILLDGKGVDRFDETLHLDGQRTEITYGRHVITLQVSAPAVATSLVAFVRGAVIREVIGEGAETPPPDTAPASAGGMEQRMADLERRVKQLESEVAAIKRVRRPQ